MERISNRAVEASINFLTRKGYEILDRNWQADDDGIAFVAVTVTIGSQGFEEPKASRASRESAAAQWLAVNGEELANVAVRFDDIALMVVNGSRAILRHHINALASLED